MRKRITRVYRLSPDEVSDAILRYLREFKDQPLDTPEVEITEEGGAVVSDEGEHDL